jgi:endogenous inhibitor of DNA gyrase (YacG/DUF329 family)
MKMQWHRLSFACPTCNRQVAILEIDASADGELSVEGVCAHCGKQYSFKTDIRLILTYCVEADILAPMEADLKEGDDESS